MLYIIPTPIGNLGDISERSRQVLESVDVLLCEDTRVSGQLLQLLQIKNQPKLVSFYDEVESQKLPEVLDYLKSGKKVGLVSDAGTPVVSDPGYLLVRTCVAENISIEVLPGANAVLPALLLSALPPTPFLFLGFMPKKEKDIKNIFEKYKNVEVTKVAYVAARDVKSLLLLLEKNTRVAVCSELTKKFEKVYRGKASEVLALLESWDERGEVVAVWR